MKGMLKTASILTWFNIIFWGALDGFALLTGLLSFNLPFLAAAVLLSAVPLSCFAALKLHASIRQPGLPLSHQTPVGIRFVGYVALFYGFNLLVGGIGQIKDAKPTQDFYKDWLAQMPAEFIKQFPQFKEIPASVVHGIGAVVLILGLFVAVNVLLNLRLLRWYYLVKKSDVS